MNNSARKELQSRQNLKAWGVGLAVKRRSLRDGRALSLDNPFHKTLARKIAAVTLAVWKQEGGFDAAHLKLQA